MATEKSTLKEMSKGLSSHNGGHLFTQTNEIRNSVILHNTGRRTMKAIVVTDQAAGTAGMKLVERPAPQGASLASLSGANYGDVVVQVHASGSTGGDGWGA